MELDAEAIVQNALDKAVAILADKPLYAEMILGQLLKAVPDHPKGLHLLGLTKQRMGKHEEAIAIITKAMELDPKNPDNFNNLALSHANLDNYEKAIEYLEVAIARSPEHHIYLNNLALQYRQKGEFVRAKELFERALSQRPTPEIWCNLGGLYHDWRKIDRAIHCFETAIALDPDCAAAHVDLAFVLCSLGQWERGLAEYEWRFKHFSLLRRYIDAYASLPKWEGGDLTGKHILLYGEQGNGDVIQFARYAKKLQERGARRVTIHTPVALQSLLIKIEGIDGTIGTDDWSVLDEKARRDHPFGPYYLDFDCHCSLMSLPHLLKDYVISGEPYLKVHERLNLRATEDYGKTFNIGVVWAGSPAHPCDETRSAYLKDFQPLSDIPGVKLFSLQVGGSRRVYTHGKRIVDYAAGAEGVRMVDMTPEIFDYTSTAKIVVGLDLVVCVDTSVAHLAGAMGKPCWVLMPYIPDWRWGLEGDRTAWYDSLRFYRQERPKDWTHVIERIAQDVRHESEVLLQGQRQGLPEAEAAGG